MLVEKLKSEELKLKALEGNILLLDILKDSLEEPDDKRVPCIPPQVNLYRYSPVRVKTKRYA